MATVGVYEAKAHFSELLERVARGEVITITKHSIPVAKLSSAETKSEESIMQAIESIKKLRKEINVKLTDDEIREMRDEGRR